MKDNSLIIWDDDNKQLLFVSKKDVGQFGRLRDVDKTNWYAVGEIKRLTVKGKLSYRDNVKFYKDYGDKRELMALRDATSEIENLRNNVKFFYDHNPTEYKKFFNNNM